MSADAAMTSADGFAPLVASLRGAFADGRTRPIAWRRAQLDGIARFLRERDGDIAAALRDDLGRSPTETHAAETSYLAREAAYTRRRLAAWMRPQRVATPLLNQPGSSRVRREPLGVVLIIAPWNYPLQLSLGPLIGALAAGNCAVVKPSELAPAAARLMAERLPQYVDPSCVRVVTGEVVATTALLRERFDHVFFTGSAAVGRIVLEAAAKHLTPVTLELGGKSPCFVDASADLAVAARRIVWGKFFNAGQTCIAPDYVLAHAAIRDRLLGLIAAAIREFYGDDPSRSADFARIVDVRHVRRLAALVGSGTIVAGGQVDEAQRYVAPTVLADVAPDSAAMRDEIFGPILPVLAVTDADAAIAFIASRPKPLALYLFAADRAVQERVLARTSSGGAVVNHTLLHFFVPELPFGGVGASGTGAYHGRASFELFSHRKGVLSRATALDVPLLYPPFTPAKQAWIRRLL